MGTGQLLVDRFPWEPASGHGDASSEKEVASAKKPAPNSSAQSRPSVHQRLGPPVGQEGSNQSFRGGQQNKSQSSTFFTTARTTGGQSRNPGRRTKAMLCPIRHLDRLRLPDNEDTLVGARLAGFAHHWQNLLGECRSSGVLLKWECHQPPLTRARTFSSLQGTRSKIYRKPWTVLEKGAIEPVHRSCSLGFFSRLFLVPKKTGDLRPMKDLSTLNRHLVIPHFQMETAQTVRPAACQDKWTVSIDIKDAYLHVPMCQSVRKFLWFCVNKKTYQLTCPPFGLATSPREFTKLCVPCGAVI